MRTFILAGGRGTRISEETFNKPKPMVLIGGKPILQHLIEIYALQGFCEFDIALGYRGEIIIDWIDSLGQDSKPNQQFLTSLGSGVSIRGVDTGLNTQTGGRIKQLLVGSKEEVFATYGDGVGNINLSQLLEFHKSEGRLATLTAVRPPARFGYLEIDQGKVSAFGEKNQSASGWINGGFFVLEPEVREFIFDDSEPFETGALPRLVQSGELSAYRHHGFWQPMDTLREQQDLDRLARMKTPPWLEGLLKN
jgi:glucose-1-phosphate cytidylyltransferase